MTTQSVRTRLTVVAGILAMIGAGACKETLTEPITVTSIEVQGGAANLRPGQSTQLSATLKSSEGWTLPNTGITWTSSNGTVATVSNAGQVSGLKRGSATITASAGSVSGTAAVTIIGVQTLRATPETLAVAAGQSRLLTVTTTQDPGVLVTLQWRSLDTAIARVDADGRITGRVAGGVTRVEVTADELKDTSVVRVLAPIAAIEVKPSSAVYASADTGTIAFRPVDANGALINYTVFGASMANLGGPTDCITLVTGGACTQRVNVGTLPAGSFPVRDSGYVWADYDAVAKGWFRVWRVSTVMDSLRLSLPTGSTVDGTSVTVGDTVPLTSTLYFPGGSGSAVNTLYDVVSGTATLVRCTTGWGTVAVQAGCVRVVATTAGEVGVRARFRRSDGQFVVDTLRVSVVPPVASVTISPTSATIAIGATRQLTAQAKDASGNVLVTRIITWTSSAPGVATVTNTGLVTAVGAGTATITASSEGKTATSEITVPWSIEFSPLNGSLAVGDHSCAVDVQGRVHCWGLNASGQLGDGSTTDRSTPALIAGPVRFRSVAVAGGFSCGIAVDSLAYCWGTNTEGQLGTGSSTGSTVPVAVEGGRRFISIVGTGRQMCALTADGTGYCWGQNPFGEVGDGTTTRRAIPTAVLTSEKFATLHAADFVTCGLTRTGSILCWGEGQEGRTGTNSSAILTTPTPVSGNRNYEALNTSGQSSCARLVTGGIECWGVNRSGEFSGSLANVAVPTTMTFSGVTLRSVSIGIGFGCGLVEDGTAYCWGTRPWPLGIGATSSTFSPPSAVTLPEPATRIVAGGVSACAITISGRLFCWGENAYGQVGDGTTTNRGTPREIGQGVIFKP